MRNKFKTTFMGTHYFVTLDFPKIILDQNGPETKCICNSETEFDQTLIKSIELFGLNKAEIHAWAYRVNRKTPD